MTMSPCFGEIGFVTGDRALMHPCPSPQLHPLQLLHRPQYLLPHPVAVQVALLKHRIHPQGGMDRRVLAVLLHEEAGGAVDVEVGDHYFSTQS